MVVPQADLKRYRTLGEAGSADALFSGKQADKKQTNTIPETAKETRLFYRGQGNQRPFGQHFAIGRQSDGAYFLTLSDGRNQVFIGADIHFNLTTQSARQGQIQLILQTQRQLFVLAFPDVLYLQL